MAHLLPSRMQGCLLYISKSAGHTVPSCTSLPWQSISGASRWRLSSTTSGSSPPGNTHHCFPGCVPSLVEWAGPPFKPQWTERTPKSVTLHYTYNININVSLVHIPSQTVFPVCFKACSYYESLNLKAEIVDDPFCIPRVAQEALKWWGMVVKGINQAHNDS